MCVFFLSVRRLLEKHANTYGFTKGLIEQLVYDYSDKFPTVIARPPISKCDIINELVGIFFLINDFSGFLNHDV